MKIPDYLWDQLARWVISDLSFSSNDVTDDGQIVVDATHAQSGGQSAIGALFMRARARGLIVSTGGIEQSTAPHRKGGMVRLWRGTEAGRLWARNQLHGDETCPICHDPMRSHGE